MGEEDADRSPRRAGLYSANCRAIFSSSFSLGRRTFARPFRVAAAGDRLATLVVAPVLLLLLMQIQFLPFHSFITWTHRVTLLADLALNPAGALAEDPVRAPG